MPADGKRLILNFTNVSAFNMYLDQGSAPTLTTADNWYSSGSANPVLNQALYNVNGWPWLPNYMYFLSVSNTTGSAQNFVLSVNGLNCATDDYDGDGLPDCWELTYWPSIYSYGPNDDPDGDGVRNLDEYLEATDPTNPLSFHPRLQINALYGTVTPSPAGNPTTTPPKIWYNLNQTVQLTAVPSPGYGFFGWTGDASGSANPLTLTMDGHKNITAIFGVTNQPNADYQFQNNLHSSVGTPPDLTNIAPGNAFMSAIVDGSLHTVYHFAQGSSVVLEPADGVIPTNIYTAVLLFSFDNISLEAHLGCKESGQQQRPLRLERDALFLSSCQRTLRHHRRQQLRASRAHPRCLEQRRRLRQRRPAVQLRGHPELRHPGR